MNAAAALSSGSGPLEMTSTLPDEPMSTTINVSSSLPGSLFSFGVFGMSSMNQDDSIIFNLYQLFYKYCTYLRVPLCLGGILGNGLILRTFLLMGVRDCVTIGFFNLAVCDLGVVSIDLLSIAQYGFNLHAIPSIYINYLSEAFVDATVFLTSFLAIQRCLCVMLPFHFKGMFTRCRTVLIVSFLWACCLLPMLLRVLNSKQEKIWETNSTYFYFVVKYPSKMTFDITQKLNLFNGVILRPSLGVLLVVCVLIMARELQKSVELRQRMSNKSCASTQKESEVVTGPNGDKAKGGKDAPAKSGINGSKERQAIIQVTIVSAIFVFTGLRQMEPPITALILHARDLSFEAQYNINIIRVVARVLVVLNSSVNFFIYYKYNTKFRQLCFTFKRKAKCI